MEVLVRNAEGNVSPKDREYAAKKLGRLDRFLNAAQRVEMVHRQDKQGTHGIEVTVFADGYTVRGEERDESLHAAIDKVSEKLESRLRKLKGRMVDSHRKRGVPTPTGYDEVEETSEEEGGAIVEHRTYALKPMGVEEAILQMELLDYAQFLFLNEDRKPAVIFRRSDGRLGLVEGN